LDYWNPIKGKVKIGLTFVKKLFLRISLSLIKAIINYLVTIIILAFNNSNLINKGLLDSFH